MVSAAPRQGRQALGPAVATKMPRESGSGNSSGSGHTFHECRGADIGVHMPIIFFAIHGKRIVLPEFEGSCN